MNLFDLRHKRLSLSQWATAYSYDAAWRNIEVEHYAYLRDRANQLLLFSEITFEIRNFLVTEAFDKYQAYVHLNAEAELGWMLHYRYDVLEGDRIVAKIGEGGHLYSLDHELLGCVSNTPGVVPRIIQYVDYAPVVVGTLDDLQIHRPTGEPWRMALRRNLNVQRWATS
ncbi:hypothetical protein P2Q70_18855 [Pseudomonas mendocina]|uniref:hypothetical protein n=1 Tax=Ectopseudomonas mendocina TaxID=300 RepID=UPI0023DACA52|nr:hypothetical protein [Pseudomonas mendocina]MDF2076649.1 hypothetical protein [Pseudomonas mendocina]